MLDVVQLSHGIGPGMDGIRQADGHRVTRWKAADRISMLIQGVSHTHTTNTRSHTLTPPPTHRNNTQPWSQSASESLSWAWACFSNKTLPLEGLKE